MLFRVLVVVWVAGTLASGAEVYSWHSFETPVIVNSRFELALHQRVRSRHELQFLDQVRGGAILRWNASARFVPFVGAYFQPQQIQANNWTEGRRFFGGVEVPFRFKGGLALTTRVAAERHIGTGRPDYYRYRSYERLVIGNGRFAPFLQNEWLAVGQGFHSVRNSGGLRMRVTARLMVEAGYLFDFRRSAWGGNRQAIVTAVKWQRRER